MPVARRYDVWSPVALAHIDMSVKPPAWATSWAISVLSDGSVQVAPASVTLSLGVAAVCDLGQLKGSQLGATSEATALIRRRHAMPVIAVTANSEDEFRERAYAVGMNGFLGKPVSTELIADALSRASIASSTHAA